MRQTRCLVIILFALLCGWSEPSFSQLRHGSRIIDSLVRLCRNKETDTTHIKRVIAAADELWRVGRFDTASICIDDAERLLTTLLAGMGSRSPADTAALLRSCRRSLGNVHNIRGTIWANMGRLADAIGEHEKAGEYFRLARDSNGLAKAYNNRGEAYRKMGNYPRAIEDYLACLGICERSGNKTGAGYAYNNIGAVYYFQENYQDALHYFQLALNVRKALGDRSGIGYTYNNIGNVQLELGDYDKALENYTFSLQVKQEVNDRPGIAGSYNNIGNVYLKQKRYELAQVNLLASIRIKKEIGDVAGLAASYNNLGDLFLEQGKTGDATIYFSEALKAAFAAGSKEWIKDAYKGLSDLAALRGDHKAAYQHYKSYIIYRDSLVSEENTRKTVQAQLQYDFSRKQSADSIRNAEQLKQEALRHDQEIRQQKLYTYGGAAGFILMLAVAVISLRAYRQKQKANLLISEQKQLVEEKQKEVLDSIHYAKRIQRSLLPSERYMNRILEARKKR
jgi:tetratricopeptide (TPR) repeat protein